MNIDTKRFAKMLTELGITTLSKGDAEAIVGIARLAVDADKKEDDDELSLYDVLATEVCKLAGADAAALQNNEARQPRGADDKEARMLENADRLKAKPQRELAYAVAYMLTIADLDVGRSEDKFLDALFEALGIEDAREEPIVSLINDAIVPD